MKKLFLLLLSFGFLIVHPVKAETVLYCKSELSTGFIKDNGSWRIANFKEDRHTVKFNNDFTRLEGITYNAMNCTVPYGHKPNLIICVHSLGSHETFIYSKRTKRFLFSDVSSGGYVFNPKDADTETLEVGTCKEF